MELRVVNIRKEFSQFPALHGVSLDIGSGELVALLGPSGSGKTTLLRLVAGLEQPTTGRIYFGREDASHRTVQERHVGFVFQHFALFRHMTVRENIGFGLKVRPFAERPSRAAIRQRADELLELVQLPGLGNRYPSQLSGGQRQRVALARALAIAPKVLLLDEPFGSLDAQVRRDLRRWLRELHDRTGHTTLFVTHDQEEALELADRVVVMSQGRIEQVGSPNEIYDRPNSPFVHRFLGDSNELPATVVGGEVHVLGRPTGLRTTQSGIGPALLFFRPLDASLLDAGEESLAGMATNHRRVGGSHRVELALEHHKVEIDLPRGVPAPELGSWVRFKPTRFALFPADDAAAWGRAANDLPSGQEAYGTRALSRLAVGRR